MLILGLSITPLDPFAFLRLRAQAEHRPYIGLLGNFRDGLIYL